jgi:NitT/TauT family transport system substrate-binding protein
MAARRGFAEREGLKLELLEVKDDQIGLKALLAGELDSYEGGAQGAIAANVRGADVKIVGCHWVVVPHGIMVKAASTRWTISRARRSRFRRRAPSPTCWRGWR